MSKFLQYGNEMINLDLLIRVLFIEREDGCRDELILDFSGPAYNALTDNGTSGTRVYFTGTDARDVWKSLQKEAIIKVKPRVTKTPQQE